MQYQYGQEGEMNALEWLEFAGEKGVESLTHSDRKTLEEAHIVSASGQVNKNELTNALAIQRGQARKIEPGEDDPRVVSPHSRPRDRGFGLGERHPHLQTRTT